MSSDIHLSGSALHHPGFARLRKHQKFNVVLLMTACDRSGRLVWRTDQIAWLLFQGSSHREERLEAFLALLVKEGVVTCVEGQFYLEEWLFAPAEREISAAPVAERPRTPSEEKDATAERQRLHRERERQAAAQEASVTPSEGVTEAGVTPGNGANVTPEPSYTRAVTGNQQERTKEPVTGNGQRPPDGTVRDKSQGGKAGSNRWKEQNTAMARQSTEIIGDMHSMGMHIRTWNHARTCDQRHGNSFYVDLLLDLMRRLADEFKQTNRPQGSTWTTRVQQMFERNGDPLNLLPSDALPAEVAEVAGALAHLGT